MAGDGRGELADVGVEGIPADIAATITRVSHDVFTSGMQTAFLVAGVVALAGAVLALLTRRPAEEDATPPAGPAAEPARRPSRPGRPR